MIPTRPSLLLEQINIEQYSLSDLIDFPPSELINLCSRAQGHPDYCEILRLNPSVLMSLAEGTIIF